MFLTALLLQDSAQIHRGSSCGRSHIVLQNKHPTRLWQVGNHRAKSTSACSRRETDEVWNQLLFNQDENSTKEQMLCYLPCHISSEPSVRVFLWMHGTQPCSTLVFLGQTSLFAGRFAKVSLKGNGITDHPQMGSEGFAGTKWAVQHLWSAWPVLPPSA